MPALHDRRRRKRDTSSTARPSPSAVRFITQELVGPRRAHRLAAERALALELEIFERAARQRSKRSARRSSAAPRRSPCIDVAAALADLARQAQLCAAASSIAPCAFRHRAAAAIRWSRPSLAQRGGTPFVANDCDCSPSDDKPAHLAADRPEHGAASRPSCARTR